MNYILTKGKPEDYEDIIDFGNYVFKLDFPSLLPKLYRNHRELAQYHYLVKEGKRIKAMVGSFPLGLKVCDRNLKVRGIGTVSVHRYSRGEGYMRLLMDKAVKEMKEEGCDFAVLGGQRQRYEYWGFTPCGISININFNSSNIKHVGIDIEDTYEFARYDKCGADDLERAVELHDSQIVHAIREKDNFIDASSSWDNGVLFIYNKSEFAGYMCVSSNYEKIDEILLRNPGEIDKVIISYMRYFKLKSVQMCMYWHRTEEFMKLSRFCENYSINDSCNIYVINYRRVIETFMNLKHRFSPLSEGVLVLNVEENGRYKIEVKDGVVKVEETDIPYHLSVSHLNASSLLFSHSSFINPAYNCVNTLAKDWFPLPLFFPGLDNV